MNKEEAVYFAGLMEDYLNIPSFICESIEKDLVNGRYKEVIEYIIQRKKYLKEKEQKEREQINIDGSVEILEEDKHIIEKIDTTLENTLFTMECYTGIPEQALDWNFTILKNVINEIIDYLEIKGSK